MRHAQLWGHRDYKYSWLLDHGLEAVAWETLTPKAPLLLFVPRNEEAAPGYERGWKVTDMFPVNSVGIVTARDALTIHFEQDELREVIARFCSLGVEQARAAFDLVPYVRDWRVEWAQQDLRVTGQAAKHFQPIAYRPFDVRHTYFTGKSKGFHCMPRGEVMRHMVEGLNNLALSTTRSVETGDFTHAFVFAQMATLHSVSIKEVNYVFPLWLHPQGKSPRPNIAPAFMQALAASLGVASQSERHDLPQGVTPEQVLAYVYAVLHGPGYRRAYAEFLMSDFPRIPIACLPGSGHRFAALWKALLPLGQALIDAHLLRKVPAALRARFPVAGDNLVEKPRFAPGANDAPGRVYLNASQYFDGVPAATWAFKVGGYQVCEKWLKDRKGRTLSLQDVQHYSQVVAALSHTRALMDQIEQAAGGALWPLLQ